MHLFTSIVLSCNRKLLIRLIADHLKLLLAVFPKLQRNGQVFASTSSEGVLTQANFFLKISNSTTRSINQNRFASRQDSKCLQSHEKIKIYCTYSHSTRCSKVLKKKRKEKIK